jgi:hypothetical protein
MATLPSVPTFTTGQTPSIAVLNQLAYCVTFLNTVPAFGQFTASQSVSNSTTTALSWTKVTDRDGGWSSGNPTRYTAQTGGYYQFSGLVSVPTTSSATCSAWFQVTTGSNNPNGSGLTQRFAYTDAGTTSGATALSLGELSPYLYVLDYVECYVFQNTGSSQSTAGYMQVTIESLGP